MWLVWLSVEQINWNNYQISTLYYSGRHLTGRLLKDLIYIHMSVRSQSKPDFPPFPVILKKRCVRWPWEISVIPLAWVRFSVYYSL